MQSNYLVERSIHGIVVKLLRFRSSRRFHKNYSLDFKHRIIHLVIFCSYDCPFKGHIFGSTNFYRAGTPHGFVERDSVSESSIKHSTIKRLDYDTIPCMDHSFFFVLLCLLTKQWQTCSIDHLSPLTPPLTDTECHERCSPVCNKPLWSTLLNNLLNKDMPARSASFTCVVRG